MRIAQRFMGIVVQKSGFCSIHFIHVVGMKGNEEAERLAKKKKKDIVETETLQDRDEVSNKAKHVPYLQH